MLTESWYSYIVDSIMSSFVWTAGKIFAWIRLVGNHPAREIWIFPMHRTDMDMVPKVPFTKIHQCMIHPHETVQHFSSSGAMATNTHSLQIIRSLDILAKKHMWCWFSILSTGTSPYPTKWEKEHHRLKLLLKGDMWSFPARYHQAESSGFVVLHAFLRCQLLQDP